MGLGAGTTVDRYELIALLGEGAQGAVWQARDRLDGAVRALKLVPLRLARGQELERVRREARLLAQLSHPGLCRCHGMFEDLRHEVLGFAMDFVDGRALGEALEDVRLTGAMREQLLLHVAEALAHVHDKGAVHRDVKLDNVLVTEGFFEEPERQGGVRLVDFGVAALDDVRQRLTATGHAVGTPAYMAPELIDPGTWSGGTVGPEADVFSFGVLAWKLFIGGHPTGISEEASLGAYLMAYRKAASSGAWPPRMPAKGAVRALQRCLALHPQDRPPNGGDVVRRLEAAMGRASDRLSETGEHAAPRGTPRGRPSGRPSGTPSGTRVMTDPGALDGDPVRTTPMAGPVAGDPQFVDIDTEPSGPPSSVRRMVAKVVAAQEAQVQPQSHPAVSVMVKPRARPSGGVMESRWLVAALALMVVFMLAALVALVVQELDGDGAVDTPATEGIGESESGELGAPASCATCPTGQSCGVQGCEAALGRDERFELRLHTVTEHVIGTAGSAEAAKGVWVRVCVADRCAYLEDGKSSLPIVGHHIWEEGLDIEVSRGGEPLVTWPRARYRSPPRRSDICDGLSFVFAGDADYASKPSEASKEMRFIVFYLDPPGPQPPRCPGEASRLP